MFPFHGEGSKAEERIHWKTIVSSAPAFIPFYLKHRTPVFFWKPPSFIINILYPGWQLNLVMANQHTQATAIHSNYSNQSSRLSNSHATQTRQISFRSFIENNEKVINKNMKKKKHRLETLSTDSGARLSASKAWVIVGKFLNLSVVQFLVCKMWITIVPTS